MVIMRTYYCPILSALPSGYKDLDWAIDSMVENGAFNLKDSQLSQMEKNMDEHDRLYEAFYGEEWFSEIWKLKRRFKNPADFYRDLYYRTAGEVEARDTARRLTLTDEQRKEKRPDIDRDDVVFSDGGVSYEINERFYDDFDSWDGSNPSVTFTIGNTSNALQSVGVKNQNIIMRSGMIINKLNKHQEMSKSIFRQIPELLENPVIFQFSDAIDDNTGKPKYDSRITVLGELYTNINGKNAPVLVSIELLPTNQKKTKILDLSVITSAYAKNSLRRCFQ